MFLHMFRHFRSALCLLLCLAPLAAAWAAPARELRLELRQDAVVHGDTVLLADLLDARNSGNADADRIAGLVVSRAPRVGYADRFTRADLERLIRTRLFPFTGTIAWAGAQTVSVHQAEQVLKGDELVDSVRKQVGQSLSAGFPGLKIISASSQGDLPLPLGEVSWSIRPIDTDRLGPQLAVWTDVSVDGRAYRSVVMTFGIEVDAKVRVARHDLNAGAEISERDFDLVSKDIADGVRTYFVDTALPADSRMRASMRRGQVLRRDQLTAQGFVFRGDELTLRLVAGGVTVETRAVAEQDGNVGDAVRMRPASGMASVSARIVAPGVAEVKGL